MKIEFVSYARQHEPDVRHFNARLQAGNSPVEFPTRCVPDWLPRHKSPRVYQEFILAVDEESQVRGAYILKHQEFLLNGRVLPMAEFRLPVSEGVVNPKFAGVGLKLLCDAAQKQPRLFGLGMGGADRPLPRLLKARRWSMAPAPFFSGLFTPVPSFATSGCYARRPCGGQLSTWRRLPAWVGPERN